MFALRFKSLNKRDWYLSRPFALVGVALTLSAPLRAQTAEAPRVGELAPAFDLPAKGNARVSSRDFVGKRAQFWILAGDKPLAMANDALTRAAQKAAVAGMTPFAIESNPNAIGGTVWPAPFQVLSDESKALTKTFGEPRFIAVDRAGWLRAIEPLPLEADDPQAFALRFLLERTPDPTPVFALGKPAPDFCLRDANGIWRRLSALRGRKNLVLTFFPRCFTGKCKTQLSSLRDSFGAFQLADTEVWAVSVDPAEGERGQKAFAKSLQLPFPLLPDEGRNICYLFGAAQSLTDVAKRQSVLIDKEGVVRFIDSEVAPETHGDDLLAHLKELGMTP